MLSQRSHIEGAHAKPLNVQVVPAIRVGVEGDLIHPLALCLHVCIYSYIPLSQFLHDEKLIRLTDARHHDITEVSINPSN